MSLIRRIYNRITRPSAVTRAQHSHVLRYPSCAACGSLEKVQGHHVLPYNKFPEHGADPSNFISLCEGKEECHLVVGHGGAFRYYNPNVVQDAADYREANDIMRRILKDRFRARRLVDV